VPVRKDRQEEASGKPGDIVKVTVAPVRTRFIAVGFRHEHVKTPGVYK
jgi:hypothetical protein